MSLIDNENGNYRFFAGIAPYSAGVVAKPGYEIVHVMLRRTIPWRQGFDLIDGYLSSQQRPRAALCGVELRAPKPFSFAGFIEFNGGYQQLLSEWDLLVEGRNPIARTNIAPQVQPPPEPSLYGFSYTAPSTAETPPTFVIAGAGDLRDQADLRAEAIVRPGETSVAALADKVACVLDCMAERLAGVGMSWSEVTMINVYTVQPLLPHLGTLLRRMGASAAHGLHWHYSHPPIAGLTFEMDVRGVRRELWIDL